MAKKLLSPGRCDYGAYLDENGGVIDNSIINKLSKNDHMVVVNAGMGGRVAEHLKANEGKREVEIGLGPGSNIEAPDVFYVQRVRPMLCLSQDIPNSMPASSRTKSPNNSDGWWRPCNRSSTARTSKPLRLT